jgi:small-conductance mechanosensitive channel|tara:strand:- start:648 stop:1544 length:897 start_codon:yes stop_codon:yes gene_type:complete
MVDWKSVMESVVNFGSDYPYVRTIVAVVVLFLFLNFVVSLVRGILMKRVKRKKQKSNVEIFSKVLRVSIFIILVIFAISSYEDSWAGLGLGLGLFSAALGWALQKPITGIAAWIMVVLRRPFEIGDRVIIGGVKGDVIDISLTHIFLNEIGGVVGGEENSGRIILVPNSTLFEKNIVNYTSQDDFILDQVILLITFESDLNKAIKIVGDAAKKELKPYLEKMSKQPYVRTYFQDNGIQVSVRYLSPAIKLPEYSSRITQEIFRNVKRTREVNIAYPHLDVILKDKKSVPKKYRNKIRS